MMTMFSDPVRVGGAMCALLFLLLAIKCFQVAAKERVEGRCVAALGTVFLIPAFGGAGAVLWDFWWSRLAVGFGAMILAFTTFFLAISGLRRFRRKRLLFDRGRKQGIAALAISGVWGGLFLFSAGMEVAKEVSWTEEQRAVFDQERDGEGYPLLEYNLHFAAPEGPWLAVDPEAINGDAKLALTRRRHEAYLLVIPELPGVDGGVTLEILEMGIFGNLMAADPEASWDPPVPLEVGGIEGRYLSARARVGMQRVSYKYWYGLRNGLAVQVVAFGLREKEEAVREDHQKFLRGMTLIDPERIFVANGKLIDEPLAFEAEGFSVDLPRAEWIQVEPEIFEDVAFRAMSLRGGQLNVTRVDFGGIGAEIDLEALVEGFAMNENVEIDGAILSKRDRELPDGTRVRDLILRFEEGESRFRDYYRFYLLGTRALIVNTWNETHETEPGWKPEQILEAVRFHTDSPDLDYFGMQDSRRSALASLVNKVGLYHFERDRFQPAKEFFAGAAKIAPENEVFTRNVVEALLWLEEYGEALAATNRHLEQFPEDKRGVALRAEALAAMDRADEAIEIYEKLFIGDFEDDDVLLDYLNLLIDTGKQVRALMVIEREFAERPSGKLRWWEGRVAVLAGAFRQGEKAFREIGESDGWDARLFGEMVDLFQTEGDHEAAWEWLDKQEAQMGATFDVWMGRGRSQLALGKLLEAHVSFSQARDQRPGDADADYYLDEVARRMRLETPGVD